jgi:diaminopimelate epimerase
MGLPLAHADRPVVTAAPSIDRVPGIVIDMPNPHVVVAVPDSAALQALDLTRMPLVEPARPDGQNVEFVTREGERHLAMRVYERGVGETRSCGTGICAAVVASALTDKAGADDLTWRVDVPGGSCQVTWRSDGSIHLAGPAVLVGEIEVDPSWLAAAEGRR